MDSEATKRNQVEKEQQLIQAIGSGFPRIVQKMNPTSEKAMQSFSNVKDFKQCVKAYKGKESGLPHAVVGPIQFQDGCTYRGQMLDGMRHGRGEQVWPDGSFYRGFWYFNEISGFGIYINSGGLYTYGEILEESPDTDIDHEISREQFLEINTNKENRQFGDVFKKGKRVGKHKKSEGEYKIERKMVHIKIRDSDQESAKLDVFSWTGPNGEEYKGHWKDGQMQGHGECYWPDGARYSGYWKEGKRHGHGLMLYPDGKRINGNWQFGELVSGVSTTLQERKNLGKTSPLNSENYRQYSSVEDSGRTKLIWGM